jgi:hypothetical protein
MGKLPMIKTIALEDNKACKAPPVEVIAKGPDTVLNYFRQVFVWCAVWCLCVCMCVCVCVYIGFRVFFV